MSSSLLWTEADDARLRKLVEEHGLKRWAFIATHLNGKTGKQCRRRWHALGVGPDDKSGVEWTAEDDAKLLRAHKEHGRKWTQIAREVGGRTDNAVKNRFFSLQKRQQKQQEATPASAGVEQQASAAAAAAPSRKRKVTQEESKAATPPIRPRRKKASAASASPPVARDPCPLDTLATAASQEAEAEAAAAAAAAATAALQPFPLPLLAPSSGSGGGGGDDAFRLPAMSVLMQALVARLSSSSGGRGGGGAVLSGPSIAAATTTTTPGQHAPTAANLLQLASSLPAAFRWSSSSSQAGFVRLELPAGAGADEVVAAGSTAGGLAAGAAALAAAAGGAAGGDSGTGSD